MAEVSTRDWTTARRTSTSSSTAQVGSVQNPFDVRALGRRPTAAWAVESTSLARIRPRDLRIGKIQRTRLLLRCSSPFTTQNMWNTTTTRGSVKDTMLAELSAHLPPITLSGVSASPIRSRSCASVVCSMSAPLCIAEVQGLSGLTPVACEARGPVHGNGTRQSTPLNSNK